MPENNEKLNRFTALILKDATTESEQLLYAVNARRKKAMAEAREQAEAEAKAYYESETSRLQAEAGRQVSRRMQESKQALFVRRNELEREVFDEVFQRIDTYTKSGEYVTRLESLLHNALESLDDAEYVRVYLRPCDRVHESLLQEANPEIQMTFLDGPFQLGGLIVEAPNLGLRVDASFDSRLQELSGHFAELFGISLAGVDEEVAQ